MTPENDDEEKEDAGLSGYASIRGKGSKKKVEKIKGGFGAVVGALAQLEANRVETKATKGVSSCQNLRVPVEETRTWRTHGCQFWLKCH